MKRRKIMTGWLGALVAGMLMAAEKPSTADVGHADPTTAGTTTECVEGFENADFQGLPWTSSGTPWTITSLDKYSGTYSARCGEAPSGQYSGLHISLTCDEGIVRFRYKLYADGFSGLNFYLDGALRSLWRNSTGWVEHAEAVSAGFHSFSWEYENSLYGPGGPGAAWLDQISFPIPVFTSHPAPLILCEGQDAVFAVSVVSLPSVQYLWRKDGVELPLDDPRVTGVQSPTLQIHQAVASDAGHYSCVVSEVPWTFESYAARLDVAAMPSITEQPQDAQAYVSFVARFMVQASATPPPGYQWQVSIDNGNAWQDIPGAGRASLDVVAGENDDGNLYRCRISYTCVVLESQAARLDVIGPAPAPQIFRVKADASGTGNGSSWADAMTDVQSAIDAAEAGDEIWVAAGTYTPTVETIVGDPRSVAFVLKNAAGLYGGFSGTEAARDQRDPSVNTTVLSGDLLGDDNLDDPIYCPGFPFNGESPMATLRATSRCYTGPGVPVLLSECFVCEMMPWGEYRCGSPYDLDADGDVDGEEVAALFEHFCFSETGLQENAYSILQVPETVRDANHTVLDGFTITGAFGTADAVTDGISGGGLIVEGGVLTVRDCLFRRNFVFTDNPFLPGNEFGGAVTNRGGNPFFTECNFVENLSLQLGGAAADNGGGRAEYVDCTFADNSSPGGQDINAGHSEIIIRDPVLDDIGGTIDGASRIVLGATAPNDFQIGVRGNCTIQGDSRVTGAGTIYIDPGGRLVLAGNACIDLRAYDATEPCVDPGGTPAGTIVVDGQFLVGDNAGVRNSNIHVRQAHVREGNAIQYNNIFLLDVIRSGGEFFVEDNAVILQNWISSQGDRYLDLAPDPDELNTLVIEDNSIHVAIDTNPALERGTLLELRAKDYECEPGGVNVACASGAYPCPITDRIAGDFAGDQAKNWFLESLKIERGAKLNLSNRAGFVFRMDTTHGETVYVKTLTLYPNAVLNTALQTLYYETLVLVLAVNEQGQPTQEQVWSAPPPFPDVFPNGAKIVDVPLLGFSLGIIGMNDQTVSPFNEFDIRIRKRTRAASDALGAEGMIAHRPDARDPETHDGVMEMATKGADNGPAGSVAAKGSFARAGDENIVVAFEYLFKDNPDAELVVYLSDKQDVGDRSFEVARVRMPSSGRPGSIGSGQFAVFYAQFPRVTPEYTLNFTRGTYVEVELVASRDGQNNPVPSTVWIDNLDPQVICGYECASFDGLEGVAEADFLLLLAAYGRTLGSDDPKSCLDSKVARDHYVDLSDLVGWDTLFEGSLNTCGTIGALAATKTGETPAPLSDGISLPKNTFLVVGKPNGAWQQEDWLYPADTAGASSGSPLPPAGGEGSRANGRLVKDNEGTIYQLHGTQGLIRLEDGQVMIPPPPDPLPTFEGKTVYVGVKDLGGDFAGVPMTDAVVRAAGTDTYAYVVPVLVSVPAEGETPAHSYKAAAKLRLTAPGQYTIEQLYGADPYHDSGVNADPPEASEYYPYSPREIELDKDGEYVFVASAFGLNDNDWLLIYAESTAVRQEVLLSGLASGLKAPTSLLASAAGDTLYVASSASGSPEGLDLYRLAFDSSGPGVSLDGKVRLMGLQQITAICERPGDGALYVAGFSMPVFPEDQTFANEDPIFTTPRWATVPADADWSASPAQEVASQAMSGSDLALPLSAVYVPSGRADFDGDADVDLADFSHFQACFNGPNRPAKQTDCGNADLDLDADVDLADFVVFQSCFNGPNRASKCPS